MFQTQQLVPFSMLEKLKPAVSLWGGGGGGDKVIPVVPIVSFCKPAVSLWDGGGGGGGGRGGGEIRSFRLFQLYHLYSCVFYFAFKTANV